MLYCKKKVVRSGIPIKKNTKGSQKNQNGMASTSKSRKESGNMRTDQIYQIVVQSIIHSLVINCPKELLIEIMKHINYIQYIPS